ncbi:MAG: glutamine--tRNA ligase [Rhodospirillaceae bacterium]|nr:glutamine--tRNA ligase [Rhodospirillaceae bacterium]|tara:strand:- start:14240 stop:15925 length:1686 start_codon:yes stop_codon:yes gene_type:complete
MSKIDDTTEETPRDFIREQIQADLDSGKHSEIVTRFPPEPNGYLHIGHAKSICLNFGVAQEFGGVCHLRFDDTNPAKEDQEFIDAIQKDVEWLGCDWGDQVYFASDNFKQLYGYAEDLIRAGKAYVDDLTADEIRDYRGTLTEPGKNSPFRDRTVEENLDLFRKMKAGEFADGERVLRAKIDMASGNINLRDPVLYRILKMPHPRTGDSWKIYPTYDFAHGQTDAIERITHSLCTLEFEDHRPLYDWLIENLPVPSQPKQYEFSRLNITNTALSKRRLTQLVEQKLVSGWDDPRMPTVSGLRRRGVPPEAIRDFVSRLAITKSEGVVEAAMLDHCIRDYLNQHAERRMAVLRPLKLVIENYPEGQTEQLVAANHPGNEAAGTREVPFSRVLYVERDDFMEDPPKKFFRLGPGREVRLRFAYFVTCNEVIKDASGNVEELRCTYDPETKGGNAPDGRKVRGTIHWVSAEHAIPAEVNLYEPLFEDPEGGNSEEFLKNLNPNSMNRLPDCMVEPSLSEGTVGTAIQFERTGYFCLDTNSEYGRMLFNRTVGLRDTWAKVKQKA